MGEVYRARDTKLNRDVAIKVLSGTFAEEASRLARFRREAQVVASLQHPNIASIYGLEESNGVVALALELVEGEELAEPLSAARLPSAKPSRLRSKSPKVLWKKRIPSSFDRLPVA
jgi:serine/threonine-protein kinase